MQIVGILDCKFFNNNSRELCFKVIDKFLLAGKTLQFPPPSNGFITRKRIVYSAGNNVITEFEVNDCNSLFAVGRFKFIPIRLLLSEYPTFSVEASLRKHSEWIVIVCCIEQIDFICD